MKMNLLGAGILLLGWSLSGCATDSLTAGPGGAGRSSTIVAEAVLVELSTPVHFTNAEGAEVVVGPGSYTIEQAARTQLRVISSVGTPAVVIDAMPASHTADVSSPVAFTVAGSGDAQHLILVLPGGQALEAVGSSSGVRSRGPLTSLGASRTTTALQAYVLARPKVVDSLGKVKQIDPYLFRQTTILSSPSLTSFGACVNPLHGGPEPRDSFIAPGSFCALTSVSVRLSQAPPPSPYPCCTENLQMQLNVEFPLAGGGTGWAMYQDHPKRSTIARNGSVSYNFPQVIVARGVNTTAAAVTQYFSAAAGGLPVKFTASIDGSGSRTCTLKMGGTGAPTLTC